MKENAKSYIKVATDLHADLTEPLCGVHQLLLNLFPGPLGRLQASSQLLHLCLHEAQAALLEAVLLPQLLVLPRVLVHLHLQILDEEQDVGRKDDCVSFFKLQIFSK